MAIASIKWEINSKFLNPNPPAYDQVDDKLSFNARL